MEGDLEAKTYNPGGGRGWQQSKRAVDAHNRHVAHILSLGEPQGLGMSPIVRGKVADGTADFASAGGGRRRMAVDEYFRTDFGKFNYSPGDDEWQS